MRPITKSTPQRLPAVDEVPGKATRLSLLELALIDTIGDYCAYCGVRLVDRPIIEDKRARALPLTATLNEWQYLMLACKNCRESKPASVGNLADYLWPDADMTFSLDGASPFIYVAQTLPVTVTIKGVTRTISQRVALVQANPNAPPGARHKAQNTIDLYRLNTEYYDSTAGAVKIPNYTADTDPRLFVRTETWDMAMASAENFREAIDDRSTSRMLDALGRQISRTARVSGFWPVWMTVFWEQFHDVNLLNKLFVETPTKSGYIISGYQSLAERGPFSIFTGTARERIKYPDAPAPSGA